jgi:uncharacterized membrane protein
MKKIQKKHIVLLLALLFPFWLIGLSNYFFSSASFVHDVDGVRQWIGDIDGILMTLVINTIIIIIWGIGLFTGYLDILITRTIYRLEYIKKFIKENPKKVLLHIGILFAIVITALTIEVFISRYLPFRSFLTLTRIVRVSFYMAAGLSAYCIVVFRGKPETMFLSLSFVIGFAYIAAHPPYWYAWDNGVHYAWAFEESFVRNVSVSYADFLMAGAPEYHSFLIYEETLGFSDVLMGRGNATMFSFPKGTDSISWFEYEHGFWYTYLAHISQGFMLFIGRSLALPPILAFKLGPLLNHMIYTLLIYFAMKRLSSGKYLLAAIAMVPTAFVLSTTYGTDHWLIGFLILGFAYYFYEVQNPDKKIELKNIIIMIAAFVIGLSPKAVYIPLMLFLFFIKKDKFATERGRKAYFSALAISILFVFVSFALPFIISGGGGEGDWRGGANVSSSRQTLFILQNPHIYTGILLRFIISYVRIFSDNYVTYFAHLGYSPFFFLVWLVIGFVAITDRNDKDALTSNGGFKALMAFLVFSTVAMFSTAMYIEFTEVGEHLIAGVQPRYKLPLLFPFLYVIGGFKIQNNINKTAYSCAVFGIMSFILLVGAWEKFILYT